MPNNEEQWVIDDGNMRQKAERLIAKFDARIGHVDLERIVFCRVIGSKVSWAGKCWFVKPPWNLLTQAPILFGAQMEGEPLDVRYIIAINDALVRGIFIQPEKELLVLLHELLHVRRDQTGCVPHDTEDFSWMLSQFGLDWPTSQSEELRTQLSGLIEAPPEGTE